MTTIEEARPLLEAALHYAGGTHTFDDVVAMVAEGRLQFWPGPRSAIVTEILQYPRRRLLNFFLAGGKIDELKIMLPLILEWGRSKGCREASLTGRPGWTRSFLTREDGWTSGLVVMSKEL